MGADAGAPVVLDVLAPRTVVRGDVAFHGVIWDIRAEDVDLDSSGDAHGEPAGAADVTSGERSATTGRVVRREFVRHPGAVVVIVLDDDERVLLQRQYRHPVRRELWEPPAGLLDIPGEDAQVAAARELAEEADLVAERWDVLVDYFTSPGGSDEAIRVFLARGLSAVPDANLFEREDEELDMPSRWLPLPEAVALVLGGAVHNPSTIVGVLAAAAARAADWATLRPADAPWPERQSATS